MTDQPKPEPTPGDAAVTERESTERSSTTDAGTVTERDTSTSTTEVDREDDAPDTASLTDAAPED